MDDLSAHINSLRHDFVKESLDEKDVIADPVKQFAKWFWEALDAKVNEPNAMGLSTVSASGKPSSRIVLLRNFDAQGFVFYTNYTSRKAEEIAANPQASLLFFWPELERQVRIEGHLQKQAEGISDQYFQSRPRTSKIGAWTSSQSKVISNRAELENDYEKKNLQYPGEFVPRPPHWGGYVLKPVSIEFWQGRFARLHDRIVYNYEDDLWKIRRLAP